MTKVVDIARKRFEKAKYCTETTVADCLREALRQLEAGEVNLESLILVGLEVEGDDNFVKTFHAGPASSNERIGILCRAQSLLFPGGAA